MASALLNEIWNDIPEYDICDVLDKTVKMYFPYLKEINFDEDEKLTHLCCLRHLLVSLGRKPYSRPVGNFVSKGENVKPAGMVVLNEIAIIMQVT